MDNQEAEFNVGQEVPVKTGSQSSTDASTVYNTIERKTVGTKLKFKPQINEGDSVLLEIEQEVSSVDSASANSDLGLPCPRAHHQEYRVGQEWRDRGARWSARREDQ